MNKVVISVDQSTQSTKAFLFNHEGRILDKSSIPHSQIYPKENWVEHDPEALYQNTVQVIVELIRRNPGFEYSLAITNQRETVIVWDKRSGKPVYNAVVWQCMRGKAICDKIRRGGRDNALIRQKTGLLVDPYFSASGVKWILDNVQGAREDARMGHLLMGTVDTWLIWKLTGAKVHATDYTNASRTLLFNIHTLDWDDELLEIFSIPRSMMPVARACDSYFGEARILDTQIPIAGVLGDSHAALVGQMCFSQGLGKATYGTGSSVMVNIGEQFEDAPTGLVTSIGFSALGKTYYAFEGNIHCTGATITWLKDKLELISSPSEIERIAGKASDNGGVYFVPAFAGLGAPWWHSEVKAQISGLSLNSSKAHICRAALESIAYQIADLIFAMTASAGIDLKEIRVDGGPTANKLLMQFQADLLKVNVVRSEIEDASAYGAFIMNLLASGVYDSFEKLTQIWKGDKPITPDTNPDVDKYYAAWKNAVNQLIK